jgi:LuxR family maltose regulon positive regulatory protein
LTVGNRSEILPWLDLAEKAPRYNPDGDAWLGEQVIVFSATAWELLGDMRKCEQLARRLAPLDGSSFWHALAACNLGSAAHWLDDDAQAVELFCAALMLNHDQVAMISLAALGELALVAADSGDWRACSLVHLARARLLLHGRRASEARSELERAAALARRGVGLVELAYVLVTFAELLSELGDRTAARELVLEAREALSNAPEPGTLVPRVVARAESGLRLVRHVSGARSVVTDVLTPREQAVLLLLPSGLSAREIGNELGISHETVKTHTRSIYRKLGASNRRNAVARARELELL